jgi:hypothetical protein
VPIATSTSLRSSFADAVARTRETLASQGFGVHTEIDMNATLKAKPVRCWNFGKTATGACRGNNSWPAAHQRDGALVRDPTAPGLSM